MLNKSVSVIVPVYNTAESILKRTIKSIIDQTYTNWELILVDDGSTNNSGEICDSFSNDKIKVLHKPNGGVSSARNYGLEKAQNEFICFVDADDILHKDYLRILVSTMVTEDADICMCCCSYFCDSEYKFKKLNNNQVLKLDKRIAIEDLCYMHQYFYGNEFTAVWGKLYKRSVVDGIRFDIRMSLGEDFVYNYYCFDKSKKIVLIEAPLYGYFIDSSGLMNGKYNHNKISVLDGLYDLRANAEEKYIEGIVSRIVNIEIILLLMIPMGLYADDRRKIIKNINDDRRQVICNKKSRMKVKIALLMSYLGYNTIQWIFEKIKNR